jgi:deoxycytidylate deaminase
MVYLEMASVAGHLGNHPSEKAGALLVDHDGRIKGIGYFKTGVPENEWYLDDCWYLDSIEILLLHTTPSDQSGGTIYTNGPVQRNQAQLLHEIGVRRVVLQDPQQDREGVPFMVAKGIQVDEVTGDLNPKQGEKTDEDNANSSED